MSIASEITRLQTAKADLKESLEYKGAVVPSEDTIDAYPQILDDIPTAILQDKEVNVGSGTTIIEADDGYTGLHEVTVNVSQTRVGTLYFYDYEGTLVESYSGGEIQALSALPSSPDHSQDEVPLTFDEWNWTLAQIKAYNTTYPEADINVGANYHTTDGKAHFYFNITTDDNEYEASIQITYSQGDTVDWGDGSPIESISSQVVKHTYNTIGEFHCIIDSNSDNYQVGGGSSTRQGSREKVVKVYLPNKVIKFKVESFCKCHSLQSISIPSSVVSVENYTFQNCYNLKSITIPSGVTNLNSYIFQNCYNLKSIAMPSESIKVGDYIFSGCYSLQSITIPSNVTTIYGNAFYGCKSFKSITIPSSVTVIYNNAFQNCSFLQSITIPSGVTNIGNSVFANCSSLQSVIILSTVISISSSAFSNCYNLKSITIPSSVTSIGSSAFSGCYSLQSITIPSGVTSIGGDFFNYCYSLQSVIIPSGVTSIGQGAFTGCASLQSVTIPSSVTSIGSNAFNGCYSLQSITIPSGVTSIESGVFSSCLSLQSVTIPSSVTSIGSNAFNGCGILYSVTIEATTPPTLANANAFSTTYQKKIYVPASAVEDYKSASNWSNFASIIEAIPS